MKIHIMTDLEGVAGVMNAADYIHRDSRYYEHACELATLEVSAAVEGALEAGATEVLVADGHGPGAMKRLLLHPRAKLYAGRPFSGDLVTFGLDGTFAAGLIIGQHAMSNTEGGHLAHTMSFAVEDYVLNDMPVGELGLCMLMAGYFGVPVVMVSGDQAACDEAKALSPGIETAAVKTGVNRGSARGLTKEENSVFNSVAIHLHPDQARTMIRAHAYRAVKRIPEFAPYRMEPPFKLVISTRREAGKKAGEKHVRKANDFLDLVVERRRTTSPARPKARRKPISKPAAKPAARKKRARR